MDPDDPFRNSFLEDSFWVGHHIFAVHFKTVEKQRDKGKLVQHESGRSSSPCNPGSSGEERGGPLVGGCWAAGRTGRASSVRGAAGRYVAAPQRPGAVCSAGVDVSTAHVVTVSTSHSWKTKPAIEQHLGFSVRYQITTFSGVGFYST